MTTDEKIRDENYSVNINSTTETTSKLYMTDEEILPLKQQGMIQEVKCSHSSLGKAFIK